MSGQGQPTLLVPIFSRVANLKRQAGPSAVAYAYRQPQKTLCCVAVLIHKLGSLNRQQKLNL